MNIVVDVTQEHIDQGKRSSCEECPIALAIKEVNPKYIDVKVELEHVVCGGVTYKLPYLASQFVYSYDYFDKGYCEPFSFILEGKQ